VIASNGLWWFDRLPNDMRLGLIRPGGFVAGLALFWLSAWPVGPLTASSTEKEDSEPVLLGVLTRSTMEEAMPGWVEEEMAATPDFEAGAALAVAMSGAEIAVYLGTWCSDSARELARLWRALDEVGVIDPIEISYIGVDRDMQEPQEMLTGIGLQLVPTFIVRRNGQEVGRIIEVAPNGIELDLLALLSGEKRGVISGSEDLE